MTGTDALLACAAAFGVAALTTPLAAVLASRVGAVDQPRARGLSERPTPLLGGLAMLAAVLLAGLIWLPWDSETRAILIAAVVISLVGAIDDAVELPAFVKLLGQTAAAIIPVSAGVKVNNITLPFAGAVDFGWVGVPLTVIGLVALMNVVNFSDGIDGLAAGVCAIGAVAFSVIAFDLDRAAAGVLAAIVAGAAAGFLVHNFPPAKVFMGDSGANLLGLLLGCVAVQGTLKTNAVVAVVLPLLILAAPLLDTGFVVAKRLRYGRPVHVADQNHFHHRLARVGMSPRRTVAYLYGWTFSLATLAVAIRFVPYTDDLGQFRPGWTLVLILLGVVALAASI
ncbi:MAG: undecaprenyl/decaprenyl-phosphate alpha-N-acetylglucosaminyl 1-phosphate transferase, partial [Actinobacteria bacterium]|nr:undecaprenyl/decaprenyl-phosphate alpha-N-acetylglucosaminyl 1-phosphate transferase [Actinomycetota bacterium]